MNPEIVEAHRLEDRSNFAIPLHLGGKPAANHSVLSSIVRVRPAEVQKVLLQFQINLKAFLSQPRPYSRCLTDGSLVLIEIFRVCLAY